MRISFPTQLLCHTLLFVRIVIYHDSSLQILIVRIIMSITKLISGALGKVNVFFFLQQILNKEHNFS